MSDLTEYARRYFNLAPAAEVPAVCVEIVSDLRRAELAHRDARSYGERREAKMTLDGLHRRVLEMITPPRTRCPHCGR